MAYEFSGLLGDIGGNMGLFIGASILTVIELFDFLYELMKERCVQDKLSNCAKTLVCFKSHDSLFFEIFVIPQATFIDRLK